MAAVLADQITFNNSPRRSDDVGALPLCTEHIDLVHIGISMVLAAGISPATSSFGETRSNKLSYASKIGAGDKVRTCGPDLGRVVLYQLSYARIMDI